MTLRVELTGLLRTSVSGLVAKKPERLMTPDGIKATVQNIPQQELFFAKEKIAGIDCAVRHNTELRRSRRAPDMLEFGIASMIREKTRAENRTDV